MTDKVSSHTKTLLVGAASADITPEIPVRKGGSFKAFMATSVHSPLTAQAVAWGEGEQAVIWVSCDLGGIADELAAEYRRLVAEQTGVAPQQIHISATHSHGAPTSPRFSLYVKEQGHQQAMQTYQTIIEKAAACAVEAYGCRRPALLGYGRGRVQQACFNRRFIMSNGRATMGGVESGDITRVRVEGSVDDEVQVVWFEDAESHAIMSILVNLASHPNQMYSFPMLGSEYPGVMRETVCHALGQEIPILFLQGACGNVSPVNFEADSQWGSGLEGVETIGRLLGGEVVKLLHSSRPQPTEGITLAQTRSDVGLVYRSFPAEEISRTLGIIEEGKAAADPREYMAPHFSSLEEKARAKAIALIDSLQRSGEAPRIEISGIRLGDITFVLTPAHQFVEFQLALKAAFPNQKVILVDLTDGAANYVPTALAVALGGYETEHRRFEPDAGNRILDSSVALVRALLER